MLSLLVAMTLVVSAESKITGENLRQGDLVANSESSQNVGLYCIYRGVTTATTMVLMDRKRSKILAEVPIRSTRGGIQQPANEWLDVVWNPQGSAVAVHDSLGKDSKVLIYHLSDGGLFSPVLLPDLRNINAKRVGIKVETIRSSGQEPIKWVEERILAIEFRYATKDGKRYQDQYRVTFDDKWQHIQQ